MSSIRGFRCSQCHAELITGRTPGGVQTAADRTPPILCCGRPLQALKPDQVMTAVPSRRVALCRRCGYAIDLVVHPAGPLVCMICQVEFDIHAGRSEAGDRTAAAASHGAGR